MFINKKNQKQTKINRWTAKTVIKIRTVNNLGSTVYRQLDKIVKLIRNDIRENTNLVKRALSNDKSLSLDEQEISWITYLRDASDTKHNNRDKILDVLISTNHFIQTQPKFIL